MLKQTRPSSLRKVFGNAHFTLARGTPLENFNYCSKDGDYVEFGELPSAAQGKRNDLAMARDAILEGKTDLQFIMDNNLITPWGRNLRTIDRMRRVLQPPTERNDTKVSLIYGRPGTGKSSFARDVFPNAYWKDNTRWWNFYEGQDTVIWDEFGGWSCAPSDYNRIFDKYKHQVELKGDVVPLRATNLVIISNFLPGQWWNINKVTVDLDSVTRRISVIYHFQALGQDALVFTDWASFDKHIRGDN